MRIKTPLITAYFFLVHCFFSAQTFAQSNDASAAQMREELMQTPCVVTADWYAGNVEKAKKISGDVIWSDFTQSGFMRFNNLPINNRTKEIYHLWIEDAVHGGDDKPMDGGRFDIRETGESIVPFSAKLRVIEARLFMVTVESPRDAFVSKLHNYAGLANVRPKFSGRFGPQESNLNFEGQIVSTNTIGFIIVESEGKKYTVPLYQGGSVVKYNPTIIGWDLLHFGTRVKIIYRKIEFINGRAVSRLKCNGV